jgi:hypothetical protein
MTNTNKTFRQVSAGTLVLSQLDFYTPNTITRMTGILSTDIVFKLFANQINLNWPLIDGIQIPDSSISAGTVYFNEIAGFAGFYSIRFFPDRIGFWRLIFNHAPSQSDLILEFDVLSSNIFTPGGTDRGLVANFGF